MIDENEIFPVLISVEVNDNIIILRFDDDIINKNKNDNCISVMEFSDCENFQNIYNELIASIGASLDYHPINPDEDKMKVYFINMDTLEQININCKDIKEYYTKYTLQDLLFRNDILAKYFLNYQKSYDKLSAGYRYELNNIMRNIDNTINILQQKELFYKDSNPDKFYFI